MSYSKTVKHKNNIPKRRTIKAGMPVGKPRCPNGEHWVQKTQRCEPINKMAKKIYLGCSRDYVPLESDAPRIVELKKLNAQELRDMVSVLTDTPTGQKNQIMGARRLNELINLIICIENRKKMQETREPMIEEGEETEQEPEPEPEQEPVQYATPLTVEKEDTTTPKLTPIIEKPAPIPINTVEEPDTATAAIAITEQLTTTPEIHPPKDTKEYNTFLFNKEKAEYDYNKTNTEYNYLYPTLDDPNFNLKIAKRKEFNDTKYDGDLHDIKEQSRLLCNADFEIMPHQLFVKNFLSFQTPYNALLLYHGLGTGKTCSAIGIAEEMRTYMKQVGLNQRIIVVASPNVQNNFRLQLFDERKLKKQGELWDLNTCIGSELLREVNVINTKGLTQENIISKIKTIINQYYSFMGYTEFANFIDRKISVNEETGFTEKERNAMKIKNIRRVFSNRLIIIDEAHNIRIADDNKKTKKVAALLMEISKYSENMRLLLLSATPMYNSYKEIIWLTNVLNLVDKRSIIREEDVFDKDGNFLPIRTSKEGKQLESGRELLQRKLTGYISYVRSENPFTFPYRIYPNTFAPEHMLHSTHYPSIQMNLKPIDASLQYVPIFVTKIGEYQQMCYDYIMTNLRTSSYKSKSERNMPNFENMDTFGYTILQQPLEALNIAYPNQDFDAIYTEYSQKTNIMDGGDGGDGDGGDGVNGPDNGDDEMGVDPNPIPPSADILQSMAADPRSAELTQKMIGKEGLSNIMTFKKIQSNYSLRYDFDYRPNILQKYGRIFNKENIHKYSSKIAKICDCVANSTGIVMIYSQFIDGGVVPMALALEEMGFTRFGSANYTKPLFKQNTPSPFGPIDSLTMKPKSEVIQNGGVFKQAKYVMITGDKNFSPDNLADLKYVTNNENRYGETVKVILITKAGAEGLDFKNIRQIHILEPWYNMNRNEQMIGRGVRNLSHCQLPFEERNVEIYLHSTFPRNDEEPADMYVYRFAEKKAVQIGKITRLMKEIAIDCILNIGQTNFTVDKILSIAKNQNIVLKLSSMVTTASGEHMQKQIEFKIGDKPFTDLCDYMDNCSFVCSPNATVANSDVIKNTYSTDFIKMNYAAIVKRIRQLFREQSFYKRTDLIRSINILREYPVEHIDYALTHFIENKNGYLLDKLNRTGYLINRDEYYAFQPVEITDERASIYDRSVPVDYKRASLKMQLPSKFDTVEPVEELTQVTTAPTDVEEQYDTTAVAAPTVPTVPTTITDTYTKILDEIKQNMETAFSVEDIRLDAKEDNWFKSFNNVCEKLVDYHNISCDMLKKYVLYHHLDTLSFSSRFTLLKYLFQTPDMVFNTNVERMMKQYFNEKTIYNTDKTKTAIVLVNEQDVWGIYLQNAEKLDEWNKISEVDYTEFKESLLSYMVINTQKREQYNDVMGFMSVFKHRDIDRGVVFKTKNIKEKKNNKGAYCNNAGKQDLIKRINQILGSNIYSEEFITKKITVLVENKADKTVTEKKLDNGIYKDGLCVILETLMRYYEDTHKNNKIWFLDLERSTINKLVDYKL